LLLPVGVIGFKTLRDTDGLALSSRNAYLSAEERARALAIPRALSGAVAAFSSGERCVGALRGAVQALLTEAGIRLDYATIADADELVPFSDEALLSERALFAVAGFVGNTRLIDNVVFGEDPPPIAFAQKLGAG
ncbi:MAG TPA: pantoate--beta-alanine ligase, partial [Polyangiaceae bacterium]|nr:pantoate--beta-alanine ligase [Polyangiaceae bacterium]